MGDKRIINVKHPCSGCQVTGVYSGAPSPCHVVTFKAHEISDSAFERISSLALKHSEILLHSTKTGWAVTTKFKSCTLKKCTQTCTRNATWRWNSCFLQVNVSIWPQMSRGHSCCSGLFSDFTFAFCCWERRCEWFVQCFLSPYPQTHSLIHAHVIQINRPLIILTILGAVCMHAAAWMRVIVACRKCSLKPGAGEEDPSRSEHNSCRLNGAKLSCNAPWHFAPWFSSALWVPPNWEVLAHNLHHAAQLGAQDIILLSVTGTLRSLSSHFRHVLCVYKVKTKYRFACACLSNVVATYRDCALRLVNFLVNAGFEQWEAFLTWLTTGRMPVILWPCRNATVCLFTRARLAPKSRS